MNHHQPASDARSHRLALLVVGALSLFPLVYWHQSFAQLFWFGDEWQLLAEIKSVGFWHWTGIAFAENVVPVFKILWGGCALGFNGSYFVMLVMLWLTHALNTVLFGRLLLRNGFPLLTTVASQILFAFTPHNIETLGWSVQFSPVLSTTFFLLAMDCALRTSAAPAKPGKTGLLQTLLHSSLSALSFSRGVLAGPVTALAYLLPSTSTNQPQQPILRRLIYAGLCLLPAIATALLIKALSTGNHQNPGGHLLDAADYGLWLFCLNPLYWIVKMDSWGIRTLALFGVVKVALVLWGLWRSSPTQRRVFVLFLIFDLTNVALVGLGRYHTGLGTTVSSRYQYSSLIAIAPFVAFAIENILRKIPTTVHFPRATAVLALALLALYTSQGWSSAVQLFADTRGTATRHLLFVDPAPPETGAVPGFPALSTADAKQLVKDYNLH